MIFKISVLTSCLAAVLGTSAMVSDAATTFNASTVVGVDQTQRTITFKTREGQTWTLPVTDPDLITNKVVQGDQVSIEIDLSDRVTKITRLSDTPSPAANQTNDDVKP